MRHRGRALGAGVVLGLLGLMLVGCSLFRPTKPELGGGGVTLLPDYSEPESCLHYMDLAIESKDAIGRTVYLGALADTVEVGVGFHAFFDQADWSRYSGTKPDDWDLDHEGRFYDGFITVRSEKYAMAWLGDEANPYPKIVDDNHVILYRRYKVWALRSDTDSLLIAVGYADLYFAKTGAGRWSLTRWNDRVDPDVGSPPNSQYPLGFTIGYRRLDAGTGG